ncbi:hypothetical protein FRX31_020013 [Thalictrum thalictroides]|uniref:Uncharacterized protein n=1 Tax=Thalictrum thalictroides TaxID=46969 RepID=A0A7J6VZU2_THATH|nr:hypothetical protein FRX31_020013 [Thalictrum thalictroides]
MQSERKFDFSSMNVEIDDFANDISNFGCDTESQDHGKVADATNALKRKRSNEEFEVSSNDDGGGKTVKTQVGEPIERRGSDVNAKLPTHGRVLHIITRAGAGCKCCLF